MTRDMAKTGATFEETWPRYRFAPLVGLVLALAERLKTIAKPATKSRPGRDTGPVYQ
jgi:hypothetical protein